MECIYCLQTLKTTKSLNKHKKVNKKCLIIQKDFIEKDICDEYKIEVEILKQRLISSELKIKEQNDQIKELKILNTYLSQQSRGTSNPIHTDNSSTTNNANDNSNNITNVCNINIYNRTDTEVNDIYKENIVEKTIEGGIQSIAQVMVNKILKNDEGNPLIEITDQSRFNLKYTLPSGEIVKDIGGRCILDKHTGIINKHMASVCAREDLYKKACDPDHPLGKGYNSIREDVENDNVILKKNIKQYMVS